ncbi:hypothetical protein HAX54_028904, partial [Datura stramonium]|nr:hypothetical protein [Datura stramonium]
VIRRPHACGVHNTRENRREPAIHWRNIGASLKIADPMPVTTSVHVKGEMNYKSLVNQLANWAQIEVTGIWSGEMSVPPNVPDLAPIGYKFHIKS